MSNAIASQRPDALPHPAPAPQPAPPPAGPSAPPSAGRDGLRTALLDSRQRWRDLVTLVADFAFETDAWNRIVFVSPDLPLGWPAAALLGEPADRLLPDDPGAHAFDPFRPTRPVRRRRAWLRRPDGTTVCLSFAAAPLLDEEGRIVGARGIGQDVTEQDSWDGAAAATLRRAEVLDHILWRMRQEVLAPRMMQAALEALVNAAGAEGAAVLDLLGDGVTPTVLHQVGETVPTVLAAALTLLESGAQDPLQTLAEDRRPVLVCPSQTRFGEQAGLVLWRTPPDDDAPDRVWDADDRVLVSSGTGIMRVILEHESIQREMARQARTDPLTGLLNRRAFMDELNRRVDRLERENLPGTLMFVDLDNFKALNDCCGHDAGDEALSITAALLRATVRPSDLVARLGGDEFAMWMDGADDLTAAERAEVLRLDGPRALSHLAIGHDLAVGMSIGIATRWPGRGEDLESLLQRADKVMYEVKRHGRGHWRVSRPDRP